METQLVIYNIGQLLTLAPSQWQDVGIIENAALAVVAGKISWLGESSKWSREVELATDTTVIDAKGKVLTPAFVEPHTHLSGYPYARADDFVKRVYGEDSYAGIAQKGGGILSTVERTRQASNQEIKRRGHHLLNEFLRHGVLTLEAKSGYSLDEREQQQLQNLHELNQEHPIEIIPTFLAHMVPKEFQQNRADYLTLLQEKVVPQVLPLATGVDVFCDPIAFGREESKQILHFCQEHNPHLLVSAHVDQTAPFQGVEYLAALNPDSLSHLENITPAGQKLMAAKKIVGIVFPTCSFHLGIPFAPVTELIAEGVEVALSTDWNPGSSPCSNPFLVAYLAATQMKMPLEYILRALTLHPAKALRLEEQVGSLELGKKGNFLLFDLEDWRDIITQCGNTPSLEVFQEGKLVYPTVQK